MKKSQTGVVVSTKMQNTAVIEVTLWKTHRIMHKRYQRHQKFMAHNPENKFQLGDIVEIIETKPLSRHKRWEIVKKVEKETTTTKKGSK